MPSFFAAASAVFLSRDAIATTSRSLLFIMPGMTFAIPIFAVEMIPHLTGFFMSCSLLLKMSSSGDHRIGIGTGQRAGCLCIIGPARQRIAQPQAVDEGADAECHV